MEGLGARRWVFLDASADGRRSKGEAAPSSVWSGAADCSLGSMPDMGCKGPQY